MLDRSNLLTAKDAAIAAVLPLREKLMASYGKVENTYKHDDSVVTELDAWAEHEIKNALRSFDDTIGYLGEEHGAEGNEDLRWLIDPIDGTEQYIRGIPFCSSMLCLVDGKDLLVSVIYNFATDDVFWAVKGGGAWQNDQRLAVSTRYLKRSFLEVSTDFTKPDGLDLFLKVSAAVKTVTRFNCSGFTACMVASGRTEGRAVSYGKGGPWDYAPGALLALEAGGVVEHLDGSPYDYLNTDSYVCGAPHIVEFIRSLQG